MKAEEVRAILEALLFVAEGPASTEELARVLPEEVRSEVGAALEALREACERDGRGVGLTRVAGGWRLQTRPDLYPWVSEFRKVHRTERLSRQALETLAVITYRQPLTVPEVSEVRGVDPTGAVKTLLERGLIRITGRKQVVGKPFLYGTTRRFLEEFGLDSLDDLPGLKEFEDLIEERYLEPQQELFAGADRPLEAGEGAGSPDKGTASPGRASESGPDTSGTAERNGRTGDEERKAGAGSEDGGGHRPEPS